MPTNLVITIGKRPGSLDASYFTDHLSDGEALRQSKCYVF